MLSFAVKPRDLTILAEAVERVAAMMSLNVSPRPMPEHIREFFIPYSLDRSIIEAQLSGLPVDMCLQSWPVIPVELFIADMDSTIISVECIDELADVAGIKPQVAAITERAMQGELDFTQALSERVALLKGLPEMVLQEVYDTRIRFSDGAADLLKALKAANVHTILASGGFTYFTERVANALGFDSHYGNRLEIKDGMLTGHCLTPIKGADAKRDALVQACKIHNIALENSVAIGDGANDLAMIRTAGRGFGHHAKAALEPHICANFTYTGLDSLIPILGLTS